MVKSLKVLHLSSEKTWRGGEQQIAYLIDELSTRGISNYVAVRENSVFQSYCSEKSIKNISVGFRNSFDLRSALEIKRFCQKEKIDVIHMHSAKSHAIGVLSATLGNKVPLILSRRVDFVPSSNWLTKWKYNHRSIKRILGVSDKITEIMRSYVKRPSICITVHSGVDINKFGVIPADNILRKEYNIADHVYIIGNTAALERHKDYFTFINTVEQLVKENIPVIAFIIGEGSLREELTSVVQTKELQNVIMFTGFRKDIIKVLPGLDVFLMTSNEEGLGTSILDAFLAGIPVVATSAGGIPEMVKHENTGLLAPIQDAKQLAENVKRILTDSNLRLALTKNAKQLVHEFSKSNTAEKTLRVYKEVLNYIDR